MASWLCAQRAPFRVGAYLTHPLYYQCPWPVVDKRGIFSTRFATEAAAMAYAEELNTRAALHVMTAGTPAETLELGG